MTLGQIETMMKIRQPVIPSAEDVVDRPDEEPAEGEQGGDQAARGRGRSSTRVIITTPKSPIEGVISIAALLISDRVLVGFASASMSPAFRARNDVSCHLRIDRHCLLHVLA